MAQCKEGMKTFNMRMTKSMWMFLKRVAAEQEESMTDIVNRCVEKYKKKFDNKNVPKDIDN